MPGFRGARRDTTTERGYGAEHTKARAEAFAKLPDYSPCCRCHKPMWKWAKDRHGKSALHYDHSDDRRTYLGFSCAGCNRHAGAVKGGRSAGARRKSVRPSWHSRIW